MRENKEIKKKSVCSEWRYTVSHRQVKRIGNGKGLKERIDESELYQKSSKSLIIKNNMRAMVAFVLFVSSSLTFFSIRY